MCTVYFVLFENKFGSEGEAKETNFSFNITPKEGFKSRIARSIAELALGSLVVLVVWGCHVFASKLASDVHGLLCLVLLWVS